MKSVQYLFSLLLVLLGIAAQAQFQGRVYQEDSSIIVNQSGVPKTLAWCGGLNNPQFATADLNHDGLNDLVVYQPDQYSILTFINYGRAGTPNYRYRPNYAKNFPFCYGYLVMRDYNRDGIQDLIESGISGFTLHKGYYNTANELCFTDYKGLYYNNDSKLIGDINAEVNPGDIPAIVDVDKDGDLDFLSYTGDGYYMSWYQNMQVEKGLPKDSVRIRLADRCWGKMIQSYLRTHTLAITCDNSSLLKTNKVTDGGNTPCLIDMDGDNDYDVLDGHRAFNHIVYLRNGKYPSGIRDSMVYQDTTWTTLGDTVKIAQWAAAFHEDVNMDNVRDLLVAPNAQSGSENYKCSQFYQNIGTDKLPTFQLKTDTFLVSDAIDAGSNSYPFFYDYNKDGKPDLFVGSKGYFEQTSGQYIARLMYLENTSTTGNPSFKIVSNDFLGLSTYRYKGISVCVGDIDNDGKDDLILGHTNGTFDWVRNTASNASVMPIWSTAPVALKDASGSPITTNGNSVPFVYDMNADGVNDLLSGDQTGYLYYFQNNSTVSGKISLVLANNQLGFIKSDPEKIASGSSTPLIAKMDNSGKEYLLMGSRSGRIFRFTGFEGGNIFSMYTRLDSAYSFILSDNAYFSSKMSAPAIADVDSDGKYEMVVGNVYGGLFLYKQVLTVDIPTVSVDNEPLRVFPNPAKNEIYLGLPQTFYDENTSICVYNNLGQVVFQQNVEQAQGYLLLDIRGLSSGLYHIIVRNNLRKISSHFLKQPD